MAKVAGCYLARGRQQSALGGGGELPATRQGQEKLANLLTVVFQMETHMNEGALRFGGFKLPAPEQLVKCPCKSNMPVDNVSGPLPPRAPGLRGGAEAHGHVPCLRAAC